MNNNETLDLWVPRLEVKFRPVRDLEVAGIATMKSGKLGVFGGRLSVLVMSGS